MSILPIYDNTVASEKNQNWQVLASKSKFPVSGKSQNFVIVLQDSKNFVNFSRPRSFRTIWTNICGRPAVRSTLIGSKSSETLRSETRFFLSSLCSSLQLKIGGWKFLTLVALPMFLSFTSLFEMSSLIASSPSFLRSPMDFPPFTRATSEDRETV